MGAILADRGRRGRVPRSRRGARRRQRERSSSSLRPRLRPSRGPRPDRRIHRRQVERLLGVDARHRSSDAHGPAAAAGAECLAADRGGAAALDGDARRRAARAHAGGRSSDRDGRRVGADVGGPARHRLLSHRPARGDDARLPAPDRAERDHVPRRSARHARRFGGDRRGLVAAGLAAVLHAARIVRARRERPASTTRVRLGRGRRDRRHRHRRPRRRGQPSTPPEAGAAEDRSGRRRLSRAAESARVDAGAGRWTAGRRPARPEEDARVPGDARRREPAAQPPDRELPDVLRARAGSIPVRVRAVSALGHRRRGGRGHSRADAHRRRPAGGGRARAAAGAGRRGGVVHGSVEPAGKRAQVHARREADRGAGESRWERLGAVCRGRQRHRHSGPRAAANLPPFLPRRPASVARDERRRSRPQHRGADRARTPRDGQRAERTWIGQHVHGARALRQPRAGSRGAAGHAA